MCLVLQRVNAEDDRERERQTERNDSILDLPFEDDTTAHISVVYVRKRHRIRPNGTNVRPK